MNQVVRLGDEVKDLISGYEGVATCRLSYLNGCERWEVTSKKLNKDGEPIRGQVFDVEQLRVIATNDGPAPEPHGGDRDDPRDERTNARR